METFSTKEQNTLREALKNRIELTNDLQAFAFMRKNPHSALKPFAGVFVPTAKDPKYPIKGRFFLKQQADSLEGFVNHPKNDLDGNIVAGDTFDILIHWPNGDSTTMGLKKGQTDPTTKYGRLFDGRMTFPFYHTVYNADSGVHENLNESNATLIRLRFSEDKAAILDKVLRNLKRVQDTFRNVSLKVLGQYMGGISVSHAQTLAFCAIKAGIVDASIHQIDGYIYFEKTGSAAPRRVFETVQNVYDSIERASA